MTCTVSCNHPVWGGYCCHRPHGRKPQRLGAAKHLVEYVPPASGSCALPSGSCGSDWLDSTYSWCFINVHRVAWHCPGRLCSSWLWVHHVQQDPILPLKVPRPRGSGCWLWEGSSGSALKACLSRLRTRRLLLLLSTSQALVLAPAHPLQMLVAQAMYLCSLSALSPPMYHPGAFNLWWPPNVCN